MDNNCPRCGAKLGLTQIIIPRTDIHGEIYYESTRRCTQCKERITLFISLTPPFQHKKVTG